MEIKPVKDNVKPKYPLKFELKEETLKNKIPDRWAQNAAAKAALGALAVITLAGCAAGGTPASGSAEADKALGSPTEKCTPLDKALGSPTENCIPTDKALGTSIVENITFGEPLAPSVNVAPLFIHGEGRGTYGCDMVTSPAFISEYEALTVINEVAKEYGLEFSDADKAEFSTVLRPKTHFVEPDAGATAPPDVFITLKTDFSDSKHGVAIEFVSVEDVKSWCKDSSGGLIEQYETKDAAAQLSEALENAWPNGIYNAGVLYDPCVLYQPEDSSAQVDVEESLAKSKKMSEEQLRVQAKDFFEWLKSQGVI